MNTRRLQLAVVGTCLLAAMTNAGSVTTFALAVFVLPGVLMAAVLGSFFAARRMPGTALILGGVVVLGWSELVNVWSGTADGPAARATFIASGATLLAVVVARSKSPALFLLAVAASVCGALLLGAGGEVAIVAVAAAVAATLTLGLIERSRRNWTGRTRSGPTLLLLSLLVGAAASGVVLVQAQRDSTQPEAIGSGRAYPNIKPPWTDPLAATRKRPPTRLPHTAPRNHAPAHRAARTPRTESAPRRTHALPPDVWLYMLAAILVLVIALAARLLAVRLRWLRLRRALAAGTVAEQIIGAWTWTRLRLEASRLPLAVAVSPDMVSDGGAGIAVRAEIFAPLQTLAKRTTAAAFASNQRLAAPDVRVAWRTAHQIEASARESLTRPDRLRLAFRGPSVKVRAR